MLRWAKSLRVEVLSAGALVSSCTSARAPLFMNRAGSILP